MHSMLLGLAAARNGHVPAVCQSEAPQPRDLQLASRVKQPVLGRPHLGVTEHLGRLVGLVGARRQHFEDEHAQIPVPRHAERCRGLVDAECHEDIGNNACRPTCRVEEHQQVGCNERCASLKEPAMATENVPYLEDRGRVVRCLLHHERSRELVLDAGIVHNWTGVSTGEWQPRPRPAVEPIQRSNCLLRWNLRRAARLARPPSACRDTCIPFSSMYNAIRYPALPIPPGGG